MLKIVDVHASHTPQGEYVVLQNQGTRTVQLKGIALCSELYLSCDPHTAAPETYIFREETVIKPYGRIVLFTGSGYDGWQPTTDGRQCYVAYWNRPELVWSQRESVHLLRIESSHRVVRAYEPVYGGVV
jgi:hypothetical protein